MIKKYYSATIIALAIVVLGLCLKGGIDNFTNRDRKVTVKGLAEIEVPADHVTWPMQFKKMGNSLPDLYNEIAVTQATIIKFLTENGVNESEISAGAPSVEDQSTYRYNSTPAPYRYIITSTLTVSSDNVDKIRSLIDRQGELLRDGIAIYSGNYEAPITYEYVSFQEMKPKMMAEAIENAEATAHQFAENSHSKLNKIISADQGQFSISDRDSNTPFIKKVRVVTTITYSLKD